MAARRDDTDVILVHRPPGTRPALPSPSGFTVDLDASGLTSADDVPLRPAVELRRRALGATSATMTVNLRDDATDQGPSRRNAIRFLLGLGILIAALTLVILFGAR